MNYLYTVCCLSFSISFYAQTFDPQAQPPAPDYSKAESWLTLPFRKDGADLLIKGEIEISDSAKAVDVFYIYPTLYKNGKTWCADIADSKLNKRFERLPLKYQAVPFNFIARIYTPLYRQGKIDCFSNLNGVGGEALSFAYKDVKRAFEYYLKHYNQGRPIIIVSHSQGTWHSRQLLKDFFDTPETKSKLVCAYSVGFAMFPEQYEVLKPCRNANEVNCYVTLASFMKGYDAKNDTMFFGKVCVNPISWQCDTLAHKNKSAVLLNFKSKKRFETEAQIRQNYLAVKTKTPIVKNWKVMHLVDFNLFWESIRKNVSERVNAYLKSNQ